MLLEIERISGAMDKSGLTYELMAIDDGSTDQTLERLRRAEPDFPQLKVIHFPRNGGAGTVSRIGTQQAKGEIVVWTDADMTYPNERIPEFVAMLDVDPTFDQVVGARTSEEGTLKIVRVPAKWFVRKLAERLTNADIPDLNSGLRAFRRDGGAALPQLLPPGFSCVTTITLAFLSNGHGVRVRARSTTPSGRAVEVPLRLRRLPVHPAGAAHGDVLQPAEGADAAAP